MHVQLKRDKKGKEAEVIEIKFTPNRKKRRKFDTYTMRGHI